MVAFQVAPPLLIILLRFGLCVARPQPEGLSLINVNGGQSHGFVPLLAGQQCLAM